VKTLLAETVVRQCFPDHAEAIVAEVNAAIARGHRFGVEKFSAMAGDRRISWQCSRCGDRVIAIAQDKKPLEISGLASPLGRCPADRKEHSK
jgi:hypothetical protein